MCRLSAGYRRGGDDSSQSVDSYGRRQLVARQCGEEKENCTCREVPAGREGSIREIESGYVES